MSTVAHVTVGTPILILDFQRNTFRELGGMVICDHSRLFDINHWTLGQYFLKNECTQENYICQISPSHFDVSQHSPELGFGVGWGGGVTGTRFRGKDVKVSKKTAELAYKKSGICRGVHERNEYPCGPSQLSSGCLFGAVHPRFWPDSGIHIWPLLSIFVDVAGYPLTTNIKKKRPCPRWLPPPQ